MAAKTVEQRLAEVENRCVRNEDYIQIMNVINKSTYYAMAGMSQEMHKELFAKTTPIRITLGDQGYWEGMGIGKRYEEFMGLGMSGTVEERKKTMLGFMSIHPAMCHVIEVAKDGKTAKAVILSMGIVAGNMGGKPSSNWEYDKLAFDFIKENGQWKYWHHHCYTLLRWRTDEKWEDQFKPKVLPPEMANRPRMKMDGPTREGDDNPYRPDTMQRMVPPMPEPYETWTDNTYIY